MVGARTSSSLAEGSNSPPRRLRSCNRRGGYLHGAEDPGRTAAFCLVVVGIVVLGAGALQIQVTGPASHTASGAAAERSTLVTGDGLAGSAQTTNNTPPTGPGVFRSTAAPNHQLRYRSEPHASVFSGYADPTGVAFDSLNGYLYVASAEARSVYVVNGSTGALVAQIANPATPTTTTNYTQTVEFDPFNGDIYVANTNDSEAGGAPGDSITVINGTANTVASVITVGLAPTGFAVNPVDGALYVGSDTYYNSTSGWNWGSNLTVINGSTNSITTVLTVPPANPCKSPISLAYDPRNGWLYAAESWGHQSYGWVCVINTTTNSFTTTVPVGGQVSQVLYDPASGTIFAATIGQNDSGTRLYVLGGTNGTSVLANLSLPFNGVPREFPVDPALGYDGQTGDVLVAGSNWNSDGSPNATEALVFNNATFEGLFHAGEDAPWGAPGMSYDPVTDTLYLTNPASGSLSLVTAQTVLQPVVTPPTGVLELGGAGVAFTATDRCFGGSCSSAPSLTWTVNRVSGGGSGQLGHFNTTAGSHVLFTPASSGTGLINVTAEVGSDQEVDSVPLAIYSKLVAALYPGPISTDVNSTVHFRVNVSGGVAPYSFVYSESASLAGCHFNNTPDFYCTPTGAGNFSVTANVTDSVGFHAVAATPLVRVGPELFVQLTASSLTPLLGQTVAFVTNVSGGQSPYSFNYSGFPPGCVSVNESAVGCLPTQSGHYNVTVRVTDRDNVTLDSTLGIRVIFDFNVVVPTNVSAGSPFTISVNTNESFSNGTAAVPAGGYGNFTYNYTGLPPGCASEDSSSLTCTTNVEGLYHITVSVHDQVGDHNSHTVTVSVGPPKPASPNSGVLALFSGATGYAIVGAIVAIALILAVVLVTRSRRRGCGPTPNEDSSSKPPP